MCWIPQADSLLLIFVVASCYLQLCVPLRQENPKLPPQVPGYRTQALRDGSSCSLLVEFQLADKAALAYGEHWSED
jgi:hypothetical protein